MREVRHPAEKVLRNQHGYITIDNELQAKLDRAGIPTDNLVGTYGCVYGFMSYYLDPLSEEVVVRWYEPGEKVPGFTVADRDDIRQINYRKFPKPAVLDTRRRTTQPATVPDDEDDEL